MNFEVRERLVQRDSTGSVVFAEFLVRASTQDGRFAGSSVPITIHTENIKSQLFRCVWILRSKGLFLIFAVSQTSLHGPVTFSGKEIYEAKP